MAQLTLTEQQSGTRVKVHVGDVIETRLTDHSGAGYSWRISSLDSTRVAVVDQTHEGTRADAGSAGTAVIRLSAKKPGVTHVEMTSSRPFPSEHPVSGRFSVDLDIVE
jgi:predicted secreted protein